MQINRLDSRQDDFAERLRRLRAWGGEDPATRERVAAIRRRITDSGGAALLALTAELDRHPVTAVADLQVSEARLRAAPDDISAELRGDLQTAAERIRDYHARQAQALTDWEYADAQGNRIGERIRPVGRAVVYAPGGTAAYPSSVLMGVVPARLAGVADIIVTTPAMDGRVSPTVLAAAAIAGAHRVFLLGGAQAVFAFAFGAGGLPRADVIVGPGNAYVTEAKRQVYGSVGLDSLAGPSEVLIISDSSAPAAWVAADLLAQAEHDEDAQCLLVSDDAAHLDAVAAEVARQAAGQPRAAIIAAALRRRGALVLARDAAECCQIANAVAPEHIQIMRADADAVAGRIDNAGAIFVGRHSCVAFGDYVAGGNHILPTVGGARFASPLGAHHFVKRSGVLRASADGAAHLAGVTARLAEAEGLPAHAASAALRIK